MVEAAISTPKKLAPRYTSSSSSSSPRSPSPFTPKRSQSVERRRTGTSGATRTTTSSGKMLPTSAITRSLSVSFQGESFWITVNKAKPTTNIVSSPKLVAPRKSPLDGTSSPRGVINSRGQVSFIRPASPNKVSNAVAASSSSSSSSRGVSPLRLRNGASYNGFTNEPSVLSFAVDVKRGRVGENRIVEAHSLRLLHNRLLQWRFVNARADSDLSSQKSNAENCLYDAWASTTKLRQSVSSKRRELQLLKHKLKLVFILKKQMVYLEDWAILDEVYISSLAGAIEALKASTLRLPVVDGAKVDVHKVKDAVCSAVDIMKAMGSSICFFLPKVGYVNSLVVEVANLITQEHVLLDECRHLLSMVTTIQVRECSLRTHISQLKCLPEAQH
ncbi:QWRF motif-containing protein 2 [Vigna unguiculata]|uniref:QWRF family n=1 Tax=Vigna unguiculata TaxID=3917 RepID=A0A4D6NU39_VIGUN|nr:QWRF motif-containing protein 2 [Vigna unguiculata]QCE16471.1 QWRF family [Vigna unguiculata]